MLKNFSAFIFSFCAVCHGYSFLFKWFLLILMSIYKNFFFDNKKRNLFHKHEIFFYTCALYDQTQYSNNLSYFFFKRRFSFFFLSKIRNRCLISGYNRAVMSKLKLSRRIFSHKILEGTMPGFYRSV